MTRFLAALSIAIFGLAAAPQAQAEAPVTDQASFMQIVNGRTLVLTRPFIARPIALQVQRNGNLTGEARGYELTGFWRWEGNRFCRQMDWGGFNVAYSCQTVTQNGNSLKFVSDSGLFRTAHFQLR